MIGALKFESASFPSDKNVTILGLFYTHTRRIRHITSPKIHVMLFLVSYKVASQTNMLFIRLLIFCLHFLLWQPAMCTMTQCQSRPQIPPSSREERRSGGTSPNHWASSSNVERPIISQNGIHWNNEEARTT